MNTAIEISADTTEYTIRANDGVMLYSRYWPAAEEARAHLVLLHGYAEHIGRYEHVGEFFASHGISTHGFDQRGYGKSEGTRAYINKFEEYTQDVDLFCQKVKEYAAGKPVFILGHSMGGIVSTYHEIMTGLELKGMILSGAGLHLGDSHPALLIKISGILGAVVPKLPTVTLQKSYISRDQEVVNKYLNDPLVYNRPTLARTGAEIIRAIEKIQASMEQVKLPVLILHGEADQLTDPEGSRQLYQRAASEDKTLKIYPELYHEILNEPEKETVMNDILNWVMARA